MTDELKPCPFHNRVISDCGCHDSLYISDKDWNTRPIEDTLRARIAELEEANRWIPVSERLPNHNRLVEVSNDINVAMAFYENSVWFDIDKGVYLTDVTHWREPLPSAPEAPHD